MPTSIHVNPDLRKEMGLWRNDRIDIFDPEASGWNMGCRLETYLKPNRLRNGIWLIRRTGVGYCEDYARFVKIVMEMHAMPELEATSAITIYNPPGPWDGPMTDDEDDDDEDKGSDDESAANDAGVEQFREEEEEQEDDHEHEREHEEYWAY